MNKSSSVLIAVSGQHGSFSEEAGEKYAKDQGIVQFEIVHSNNMEETLAILDNKEANIGVIPVYNKIQGVVMPAMEAIGRHTFKVIGTVRLAIAFCLLAKKGKTKKDIRGIAYYPVAANQCRKFLGKEFPGILESRREDTALAAKELAEGILPPDHAVIAPKICAKIYDLDVLAENIQDDPENFSDFIVVTK